MSRAPAEDTGHGAAGPPKGPRTRHRDPQPGSVHINDVAGRTAPPGLGAAGGRAVTAGARPPTSPGLATSAGGWLECSTSTSTCSGKIRKETWIAPVGPAASSRARNTVSLTPRVPSSFSGDSARQRRTKSRISGIQDGRAGKVWDSTTTGTTSIDPSPFALGSSVTVSSGPSRAVTPG